MRKSKNRVFKVSSFTHRAHVDFVRLQPKDNSCVGNEPNETQVLLAARCAIGNFWKRTDPPEVKDGK